ncbi:MAG: hypothetical protein IKV81_06565 [Clostridia bacterium]|nr:hypothetical protein [Clostridia bacterium]
MKYKILTEKGMNNTNIDGARAEYFNAGMRDGIVKGAFNEGTFTTLASNQISFDTCELRISGHRVLVEEAWSSTFSTRPKTPTRFAVIGEITVGEDSSVQFDLFAQLASTKPIKNNLFKQQNGAGTYQVEIGRFTLNTDGNIIDVTRTLDIITGSRAEDLDGTINIGKITTNTLNPGMEAEFDVEQRYDPEQEKVVTDFTVGIPQGEKGLTADGVEELIAGKADLQNPSQMINANSLILTSIDENYIAGINLTGFSGDYAYIKMTSNGLEFRTFDESNDSNNASMQFKCATFIQMIADSIDLKANSGRIRLETSTTVDGSYLTVNGLLEANKGITATGNITTTGNISASGTIIGTSEQLSGNLVVDGTITANGNNVVTTNELLDKIYPVGSLYMSVQGVSPASFLGGTWEQLPAGYALWTATSGAGSTIAAGLPNITGQLGGGYGGYITNNRTESGALYTHSQDGNQSAGGSGQQRYHIAFDASRSNSIYGSSTTVQPPAYKIYAWERTA